MLKKLAFGIVCLGVSAGVAFGVAAPAADAAANYGTTANWFSGSNQGVGFGAWTINDNAGGHYIGQTGLSAGLAGNPDTFGIFNTILNQGDQTTEVIRPFSGTLAVGETFSIQLGFNQLPNGAFGIDLRSGNNVAIELLVTGGQTGTPRWLLNDGGSNFDAGSDAIVNTAYTFTFTYNGGQNYSFSLTGGPGGNGFNANNSFVGSIDNLRIFNFNQGANGNFGFDNLSIVPEPTTISLLTGPALLGAFMFVRRRRA